MDFSQKMDLVNGDFKVTLYALDRSAIKMMSWEAGVLDVWFKEGSATADNQHTH